MTYQIAVQSLKDHDKERNGDAACHAELFGVRFFACMVADGVGSSAADWLASKTACERYIELLSQSTDLPNSPAKALSKTLERIDGEILVSTGRSRGMKCAAVAVVWEVGTARFLYSNIGDTRLYQSDGHGLRQVSEDDSMAVVRRGSDGKPLISGGMAVVQRGITRALGTGMGRIEVKECELGEGESLVLCSDGFYGCSPDFEPDVDGVLTQADLRTALALLAERYEGINRDDATVLILRRETSSFNSVTNLSGGGR